LLGNISSHPTDYILHQTNLRTGKPVTKEADEHVVEDFKLSLEDR
jgi:hypothetical protein